MTGFNGFPTKSGAGGGSSAEIVAQLSAFPRPYPTVVDIPNNGIYQSNNGANWPIPASGVFEGGYMLFPSAATTAVTARNAVDTQIWNLTPANFYTGCTNWGAPWYLDPVDGQLYMLGTNGTTTTYFGTVDPDTGTATNIGTSSLTFNYAGSSTATVMRPTPGSGDLIYYVDNGSNLVKLTVNSGTGAVSESTAATYNSRNMKSSEGVYPTANGTWLANWTFSSTPGTVSLNMYRGGAKATVQGPASPGLFMPNQGSLRAYEWYGYIYVACNPLLVSSQVGSPYVFEKASFDAWLDALADSVGLPEA